MSVCQLSKVREIELQLSADALLFLGNISPLAGEAILS